MINQYASRDISWLSFNGRVLEEATDASVPLMERFRFLSIFSSNLDEFYRVRMSALLLLHKVKDKGITDHAVLLEKAQELVTQQQKTFGHILSDQLLPLLRTHHIHLLYNEPVPTSVAPELEHYFRTSISTFLQVIRPNKKNTPFFLKSNQLYLSVSLQTLDGATEMALVRIPSDHISRFYTITLDGTQYIFFLEDIIKQFLPILFPGAVIKGAWNIKITRDAELDLADEYDGDLAEKIEKQLAKRDEGSATRFLYETGFPLLQLYVLVSLLKITDAIVIEGGRYHNLKDLSGLPVHKETLNYPSWPPAQPTFLQNKPMFESMAGGDKMIHPPYHSYDAVLRFFNEAATDPQVKEIYTTLYRVAGNSGIVNALITAAENGKEVTVFIELKARFDEENNIRWSKKMKAAGIKIINSIPGLKVHAKVALLKKKKGDRFSYYGLLATGNLNEITAKFYTDHILFTTQPAIVMELELLFLFLARRRNPVSKNEIHFRHLLVAQFNLQDRFLQLIDREMSHAKNGKPAGIIIKMNNLEEQLLIDKLYEASQAGVQVQLIVRSICCLVPGMEGMSENISVTRIVDRFLEHGRVFIFKNAGDEQVWLGSADWMNRNIYRRIEVCFPLYDPAIKKELCQLIDLQLQDNVKAVKINMALDNERVQNNKPPLRSQEAIYTLVKNNSQLLT